MKRINIFVLFVFCVFTVNYVTAKTDTTQYTINKWFTAGPITVLKPAFAFEKDLHGKHFKSEKLLKLKHAKINYSTLTPILPDSSSFWHKISTDKNGTLNVFNAKKENYNIFWQATYIHVKEYMQLQFIIDTRQCFELYVDNNKKLFNYSAIAKKDKVIAKKKIVKLEPGRHLIMIKSLFNSDTSNVSWKIKVSYSIKTGNNKSMEINLSPKTFMDINHLMNGEHLNSVSVSPQGDYYLLRYTEFYPPNGKNEHWSEILDAKSNNCIFSTRYTNINKINWVPKKNNISYITIRGGDKLLISTNLDTHIEKVLMRLPKNFGDYTWADNGDFLIYSITDKLQRDKSGVYKIEGMPDRWPWYRSRSQLYILRLKNLLSTELTYGHLSCNLQDISPDEKHILFSQSLPQYTERPYYKQIMMEMDLNTYKVDTLWTQNFSSVAQYSPDGKKLLITGSAALFNNAGVNLKKAKIPNDYDTQAFIYNLLTKKVVSITKHFNPSIVNAVWSKNDKNIYFLTEDRTYRNIYVYKPDVKRYKVIPVKTDVVNNFSFSRKNHILVYSGSSISYPTVAYSINLLSNKQKLIVNPEKQFFKNVIFGKTEDWTFKNKKGLTIDGRIYFPPDFNPQKKYPLIVYYYGGTSPTARNFGGRYPKNLFAAYGYVVYDLQPSGATGYGQDFSALHVNGWGVDNADDIIEGTKKFIKAHNFINKHAVGCMGASYGGYMTMYLQTRTNIFSAAIAHAGISSISSYWGQGYWGYLYSSVASANSFPWNNRKLYVNHSPLFNANKVKTPILLLHGTSDTNVPTGESIQFYTALKLLGKPVTLVEIEGQNHHIIDYNKRIRWQKTIMAWFDKYLKGNSEWWNYLYPKKNL